MDSSSALLSAAPSAAPSPVSAPVGSGRANEVVLKQLGAVTIGSARIELLAGEIAGSLKVGHERGRAAESLAQGSFTVPPWSTVLQKDVVAWATITCRLLSARDSVFRACGASRFTGTRGDTIAAESSDGSVFPADEEFLSRMASRLDRQLGAGLDLRAGLDYHDETGHSWPLVTIYRRSLGEAAADTPLRLPLEWTRWLSA